MHPALQLINLLLKPHKKWPQLKGGCQQANVKGRKHGKNTEAWQIAHKLVQWWKLVATFLWNDPRFI